MRQIFVGSTQRSELYAQANKTLLPTRLVLIGVLLLLILIPVCFADKIFDSSNGDYSNVVLVRTSSGTGSAVYVGNQYLLTAAHVVADMTVGGRCQVEFQNPNVSPAEAVPVEAELIAMGKFLPNEDFEEDYALLKIQYLDVSKLAIPCALGTTSNVKTNDNVLAEGYPNGYYSSTNGTINNINGGITNSSKILVVDAKAWGGNSGGALKDANTDQLLGIVTMGGTVVGKTDGQTYVLKIDDIRRNLTHYGMPF